MTNLKMYIDWDKVVITNEIMDYVMPKYGKANWKKDNSWSDIILYDIYNTFYKELKVVKEPDVSKELEVAKQEEVANK
nr:hypothetical protein [Tanacetum cinerariifolium]